MVWTHITCYNILLILIKTNCNSAKDQLWGFSSVWKWISKLRIWAHIKALENVVNLYYSYCSTNNKLHIASCYVWRNGQGLPQLQSRSGINSPEKRKLRRVYRRIKNDFDIIKYVFVDDLILSTAVAGNLFIPVKRHLHLLI